MDELHLLIYNIKYNSCIYRLSRSWNASRLRRKNWGQT